MKKDWEKRVCGLWKIDEWELIYSKFIKLFMDFLQSTSTPFLNVPITPVPEDILWSYTKRELILIYGNIFSQRGLLTFGTCWMKILSLRTPLTVLKDIYKGCTRMGHSQDWASLHDPSGRARSLGRPKLVRDTGKIRGAIQIPHCDCVRLWLNIKHSDGLPHGHHSKLSFTT